MFFEGSREVSRILDCITLNGRQFCLQVKVETQPDKRDHREPKEGRALVESANPGFPICGNAHAVPWVESLGGAKRPASYGEVKSNALGKPKYRQDRHCKGTYD